jgi:hypothetical protein
MAEPTVGEGGAGASLPRFVWTHNPDDPCSLCVTWLYPPDRGKWVEPEDMTPLHPDGTVADRIYRNLHPDCINQGDDAA